MEEFNNENPQYKYDEVNRPFDYDKHHDDFDWKKPCPYGKCPNMPNWQHHYGPNWQHQYGSNFYGPFMPGGYNLPWLLLYLKSLSPRDLQRYMDEVNGMGL